MFFFFFKQKTAYEMRISDWSSDVCSSDLFVALAIGVIVHDEADMLEKGGKGFIFLHRPRQFGQVFETAGGFGGTVRLQHCGIARFLEDDARKLRVRQDRKRVV